MPTGLPYHHRNNGLCLSHAAVNGGAACGMGKRNTPISQSAYKSADWEQANSPICLPGRPSVSSFGQAVPPVIGPLIFCFASTVLERYVSFSTFSFFCHPAFDAPQLFFCKINVAWLAGCKPALQKSSLGLHSKRISAVRFAEKPFAPIPEAEK